MLVTSSTAFYAPLAPRPVRDVCAVVLLHVGCAGQSRVAGLIDGLDIVLALNLYHALCRNVLQWSQAVSPTAIASAWCTPVAWSYGYAIGR